jgi:O-antigen/teichoic acid export membrane protein
MILVSFFSILTGVSSILVTSLDGIMINQIMGLSDTGIYSTAAYFATLIVIPSRTINNASNINVSESFKAGNLAEVKNIYYKSCLVQFIIAIYLFLGLSSNMDFINWMLPEFIAGNGVIFFLGLSGVIDMSTGINTAVILFSKYYRFNMYALLILVALVIVANLIFIPIYGITGAAIAALIAMFIFNLIKYIFILVKFKFQPFNYRFLLVLGLAGALFWLLSLLKLQMHPLIVLGIKGTITTVVMGGFLYFTKLSPDVNAIFDNILKRFFPIKK